MNAYSLYLEQMVWTMGHCSKSIGKAMEPISVARKKEEEEICMVRRCPSKCPRRRIKQPLSAEKKQSIHSDSSTSTCHARISTYCLIRRGVFSQPSKPLRLFPFELSQRNMYDGFGSVKLCSMTNEHESVVITNNLQSLGPRTYQSVKTHP